MKLLPLFSLAATLAGADVVLDDFNDPFKGQTTQGWKLGAAAKAGYWYGYNDWNHGRAGLGTIMLPDVVNLDTNFVQAVADDCGEGSPCLHFKAIGGTGYAYPFSGVGFNFLSEGKDVDLSTMDSITFRAKGKGSFRFKLMTKHITDDFDRKNYWADMGSTFTLKPAWQRFTIAVDDILPQDGAPLADTATWQECMDHVRKIHLTTSPAFKARDTLDLWIDDIVMHGVSSAVFGGTWKEDSSSGVMGSPRPGTESVAVSGSRLVWDSRMVRRLEAFDAKGNIVFSCDGRDGSIALSTLPRGVLTVRASLKTGGTSPSRVFNIR